MHQYFYNLLYRVLKEDGISIPSSYSNYLAPMTSAFLYNSILKLKYKEREITNPLENLHLVNAYRYF